MWRKKFIRYTVPYTIAFIAEWIVFRVFGTYLVGIRTYFAYLFSYTDYVPKIITYWSTTFFAVCLLIVPTFGWVLRNIHWRFKPLELSDKASFNIFLIQLIYHNFTDRMYELIPNRGLQLTFNFINCVGVGLLFYYIEQPITRYLIKKIKKCLRHSQLP